MRKRVFISYRRHQSKEVAVRVANYLRRILPEEFVFLDTTSIASGHDFPQVLRKAIDRCDVFLVLIETGWSELRDASQNRRLDDPADYVRIEVRLALEAGKTVVPILLDGAAMPRPTELPSELRSLCTKQALSADGNTVETSMDRLILEQKIGVLEHEAIIDLLKQYRHFVEWEPNLRHKALSVREYCSLRPYESLVGLLDLTVSGNAKHFLAFSTAGLYHRSIGTSGACSFKAFCRIVNVSLDEKRSTLFLDNEAWDIVGTMEEEAFELIKRLLKLRGTS